MVEISAAEALGLRLRAQHLDRPLGPEGLCARPRGPAAFRTRRPGPGSSRRSAAWRVSAYGSCARRWRRRRRCSRPGACAARPMSSPRRRRGSFSPLSPPCRARSPGSTRRASRRRWTVWASAFTSCCPPSWRPRACWSAAASFPRRSSTASWPRRRSRSSLRRSSRSGAAARCTATRKSSRSAEPSYPSCSGPALLRGSWCSAGGRARARNLSPPSSGWAGGLRPRRTLAPG